LIKKYYFKADKTALFSICIMSIQPGILNAAGKNRVQALFAVSG